MRSKRYTKFTSVMVALTHLFFSVFAAMPGLAHAQTVDVEPPSIELELVEVGVRGETQVFSATVTDNDEISSMILHYRNGTDGSYLSVPMYIISGTSIYTASLETDSANTDVIQYYMEARDAGGNRTVQGFAFDPFERTLVDEELPVVSDESTVVTSAEPVAAAPMSTNRKIVYGVLGLLLVGGLASSLGGGSSGGADTSSQVPVTLVVEPFQ